MASDFNRWEKDPFFSAAEEVQESADRMESTYRTWIHAKKDVEASSTWDFEGLCRDLQTRIGTTKWQLEEFEQAVNLSYGRSKGNDDARDRHGEFIVAIEDHISRVQDSLKEGNLSEGEKTLPWVRLNKGERDELELFLSSPSVSGNNQCYADVTSLEELRKQPTLDHMKSGWGNVEAMEAKSNGHRRAASASADIGAWNISIATDGQQPHSFSSNVPAPLPPRKVPSLSGLLSSLDSQPKFSWPKNGIRKWKVVDRHQASDTIPLRSSQFTEGIDACFEKTKDCLDESDECYNKRLHSWSWYGVLQRQLQRSQYQMQYNRPSQLALWILILFLCLVVVVVFCVW